MKDQEIDSVLQTILWHSSRSTLTSKEPTRQDQTLFTLAAIALRLSQFLKELENA